MRLGNTFPYLPGYSRLTAYSQTASNPLNSNLLSLQLVFSPKSDFSVHWKKFLKAIIFFKIPFLSRDYQRAAWRWCLGTRRALRACCAFTSPQRTTTIRVAVRHHKIKSDGTYYASTAQSPWNHRQKRLPLPSRWDRTTNYSRSIQQNRGENLCSRRHIHPICWSPQLLRKTHGHNPLSALH